MRSDRAGREHGCAGWTSGGHFDWNHRAERFRQRHDASGQRFIIELRQHKRNDLIELRQHERNDLIEQRIERRFDLCEYAPQRHTLRRLHDLERSKHRGRSELHDRTER